ncbi:MAG: hypothetical protein Kow0069_29460 [Promethearchaeota archaeon]
MSAEKKRGRRGPSAKIFLGAFFASVVLAATVPFVAHPGLRGAPWGWPELGDPHVRGTLDDRLVFTYYFYWYNWASGQHFTGGGCDDHNAYHPVDEERVSYLDPDWHYREFVDVARAGIDVVLPVYWGGNPGSGGNETWSKQGLGPMRAALDRMRAEGFNSDNPLGVTHPVPKVAMFFDTTLMCVEYHDPSVPFGQGCTADLTNATHCETFYLTIADFFSAFNETHLLRVPAEGTDDPTAYVVWLYGENWFARVDQSCLDYADQRFRGEFGHALLFVGTPGWRTYCPGIEGTYRWGVAVSGVERVEGTKVDVVALGPGFYNGNESHGAVCQVGQSPIRVPRSPEWYAANWSAAIAADPNWIVVETWNEFHEGSVICRTREFGDAYLNVTAQYSAQFHASPPKPDAFPPGWTKWGPLAVLAGSFTALAVASAALAEKGVKRTKPTRPSPVR